VTGSQEPNHSEPSGFRAGFVAILGLANVGKSTLLNALVGERLSIVTPKAQTTRRRLLGIYTDATHQALFLDTPGWLEPRYALQEAMQAEASGALADADVVVAVVDAAFEPSLAWALELQIAHTPKILCINKIDRITESVLEDMVQRCQDAGWETIVPTAADRGFGTEALRRRILAGLPESPAYYPDDELSDAPERDFVAELVRETCLEQLGQEVPYAIAVRIEQFKDRGPDRPVYIEAILFVEKESQKGIVIGAGGKMIRRIGIASRTKIEDFLERKVYLELRTKVLANWRKQNKHLRVLGFRVPAEEG
jgi:GTP-binding protein Era